MKNIKVGFHSNATSSFLTLVPEPGMELLEYQLSMIANNPAPTLLPINLRREDGQIILLYDIKSRQSLTQILEQRKLRKQDFINLLHGIIKALKDGPNLFLNDAGFCLEPDLIYINPVSLESALLYLPVTGIEEQNMAQKLADLTKLILANVDEQESLGDNFTSQFMALLDSGHFSLQELEIRLNNIRVKVAVAPAEIVQPSPRRPVPQSTVQQNLRLSDNHGIQPASAQYDKHTVVPAQGYGFKNITFLAKMPIKKAQIFVFMQVFFVMLTLIVLALEAGARGLLAVVIIAVGADVVLFRSWSTGPAATSGHQREMQAKPASIPPEKSARQVSPPNHVNMNKKEVYTSGARSTALPKHRQPCLLQPMDGGVVEKYALDKKTVLIGRVRGQVDIYLNFKSISRIHAKITYYENKFYIEDLNSRNHTYVNGQMLPSNTPCLLKDGDKLCFADKDFVFQEE